MRSRKNVALLFLCLTTVTAATIAWQQHQELIRLRAAATDFNPLSSGEKRVGLSEKSVDELDSNLASAPVMEESDSPSVSPEATPARPRGGRREGPNAEFRAMMERPEIQRLMAIQQKSALDSHYSDLFRNLSLSPDQLDRFKELLVEKRTAVGDVRSAAREQGLNARNDPAAIAKLVTDAQAEIDESIRATLGEAGFAQYENYEKTLSQRTVVNQLERRLSYSSTPLSSQQTDQMVAILATTSQPTNDTAGPGVLPPRARANPITDATINQALGVLAAPQIEALRQLQQEQQAQSTLNAALRNRSRRDGGPPPAGDTVHSPTAGPAPQPSPRAGG